MTIDERVEALTQSVELLAAMHKENEAVFKDLFNRMGRILERHDITLEDHDDRLGKLEQPGH
jgi:hypothetical protein